MQNRTTMAVVAALFMTALYAVQVFSAPEQAKQAVVSKKGVSKEASPQAAVAGNGAAVPANAEKINSPDSGKKSADSLPPVTTAPQCTVKIISDPAGAAVYVDDSLQGTAPLSIAGIAPGNHVLTLKKKGCFLKKADITVDSTATAKEFSFVLLQPGFLKVETTPSGAELWIDDKKEGTTPYETDRIKPGDHSVKLQLNNYTSQERTVKIENSGRDSLKITLEYSRAYKDELAATQAVKERERNERMYLGIVSGIFVVGALILVFIEGMGQ
jgi:hypothetical protein